MAFDSLSSNLVPDDTNRVGDVFVRDRWKNVTERVSVGRDGAQGNNASFRPAISADGRFVAFASAASNLVAGDSNGQIDVFVRDREAGITRRSSVRSTLSRRSSPESSSASTPASRITRNWCAPTMSTPVNS